MFEPQRLLARLNPVSLDWKHSSKATGDILTAHDVAAALSGLPRGPYLLLLYLWADDHSVVTELQELLLKIISQIAKAQNWKCKDEPNRLALLTKMALYESKTPRLCNPCIGTGVLKNTLCIKCNGGGRKKMKLKDYSSFFGVRASNWEKCWSEKYNCFLMILYGWENEGCSYLASRIY